MDISNKIIEAELKSLKECYIEKKEVLKLRADSTETDEGLKLKLLRRISLYNTRITIIIESMNKLENKIEKRQVLKLNDWQLN